MSSSAAAASPISRDQRLLSHLLLRSRFPASSSAPSSSKTPLRTAIQGVSLQLAQGKLYAVVGGGKAEMLRLLGKVVHPTGGEVFVPPHLSIEHVEQVQRYMCACA